MFKNKKVIKKIKRITHKFVAIDQYVDETFFLKTILHRCTEGGMLLKMTSLPTKTLIRQ
jgi:hypothetical protein